MSTSTMKTPQRARWWKRGCWILVSLMLLSCGGACIVYVDPDLYGSFETWRIERRLRAELPIGSKRDAVEAWIESNAERHSPNESGWDAYYEIGNLHCNIHIRIRFALDVNDRLNGVEVSYNELCW